MADERKETPTEPEKEQEQEQKPTPDEQAEDATDNAHEEQETPEKDASDSTVQLEQLQQENASLRAQLNAAKVNAVCLAQAQKLGIDAATAPYVVKLTDLTCAVDTKGAVNEDEVAKAMQKVLDALPILKNTTKNNGECPPVETMLEVENEGAYCCDSYTEVLKSLLKVQSLSEDARNLLMQFCLMPLTGIHKKRFAKWTGQVRELQGLIRLGWIQEDSDGILSMNGLVKDMVAEQLHPTTEKCKKMLSSMVIDSKQAQNPNASELIQCMGSVMQTLQGLDKTTLEYVSAFMEFIQRNGVNVRQMLLDELQKEDGNTTEKRIGVLFLEVQQLMMECTVAQMSNTSVTFGDKGNALLEELQSLMAVLDKSVVACLTAPCYMLIGIATMSRDVVSLIRLIRMKDSMIEASEGHLPSYVGDVLALYGVLDSLYERPELTAVFKELLETKLKDSVKHEDSEEYIASLRQLRSVAENVSQYDSFIAYQEEMTRLARTIPMLYSVFRRADIAG